MVQELVQEGGCVQNPHADLPPRNSTAENTPQVGARQPAQGGGGAVQEIRSDASWSRSLNGSTQCHLSLKEGSPMDGR